MDRPTNASPPIAASCGPAPASGSSAPVRAAMLALSFGAVCAELGIAHRRSRRPRATVLAAPGASRRLLERSAARRRCSAGTAAGMPASYSSWSRPRRSDRWAPQGASFSAALRWVFARRSTPFERWYASLFPKMAASPTRALYERIALRGAGPAARSTVAPFADVIALGTVQEKQSVVTMVADEFRPAFAPALRSALTTPNRRSGCRRRPPRRGSRTGSLSARWRSRSVARRRRTTPTAARPGPPPR